MKPPLVLWAQRADKLFLTVEIEDCKAPQIDLTADKLHFKGKSDSISRDADRAEREVTIEFYKPVKVDESKHSVGARGTEFVIIKQESSWWPRLLKDSAKQHWLKVDFPKWKDEDDSEDESGLGGPGGMGGLGGMDNDFFQQFAANAGAGGMGGGPFGGDVDNEEDDESEDDETERKIPDLEETS